MAGKFELYTDAAGKYRFRLKAGNGEIIAVGEAYGSKTAAMNGIDSIKRQAAEAQVHDMTSDMPNKPGQSQSPKPSAHKPSKPAKQPAGMSGGMSSGGGMSGGGGMTH